VSDVDRRPIDADDVFAVLDLVAAIPPGRVMTYGDIAAVLGISSARAVGRVMAVHGHRVAWQRVVRADGSLAEPVRHEQLGRLRSEGAALRGNRVELGRARWRPDAGDERSGDPRRP
jgi:methylated-DNA-protein-cysteine methyltransferase-like protein